MDSLIYILFICIIVPLALMLPLLRGHSRLLIGYMIVGIFVCLFVSGVNGYLLSFFDNDMYYVTTTITPITEEFLKALPILYFAILFSDDRSTLISISFATGVGFAVLENMVILVQNIDSVSFIWALVRGFSSGLMHGICTMIVGLGISMIRKRRKLFINGVFALLATAIIYHATYNALVQSSYKYLGFVLPIMTYLPLIYTLIKTARKRAQAQQ